METTAAPIATQPTEPDPSEVVAPTAAPVLVTEQQVLLGTAAAARRPTTASRAAEAIRGVATAVRNVVAMPGSRPRRPAIPARSRSYYESSLVSREWMRL
jgi:hypothetical protein